MNRPWMPFYISDYLADTGHLSTIEHGAYMLLIFHYWQNGGVPDDDTRLARIARLTAREWKAVRPTLAGLFRNGWRHKRLDQEIEASNARYEKRAAAGRGGGNAKASRRFAASIASAMPEQNGGNVTDSRADATTTTTTLRVDQPSRGSSGGLGTGQGGGAAPVRPCRDPAGLDAPFGVEDDGGSL